MFGLLEEEEAQETQLPGIRKRETVVSVDGSEASAEYDFSPEEDGTVSARQEETPRREEDPVPDTRLTDGNGRLGDLAELLLETVKGAAGRDGESELREQRAGISSRNTRTGELWYERVGLRVSGVERLYREIGANRLQGLERKQRNVVVRLGEAEQKTDGDALMDIRALDRVFQRDARRYDGGLSPL